MLNKFAVTYTIDVTTYSMVSLIHLPRGWQTIFGVDLTISLWAIIGVISPIVQ